MARQEMAEELERSAAVIRYEARGQGEHSMDHTLELLSTYACELTYEALPAAVVHQVKRTLIDTLGCAMGAFHTEPARIARHLAESVTSRMPARLLGMRHASSPDMAGFANHDGAVTPASFTPERVQDPALRPLIAKMTIDEDKDFTQRFPQESNCRIEVTTVSGQHFVAQTAYPKGHQRNPLSDADVGTKFRRLAGAVLMEQQCSTALELLWGVERLPNLQALFETLVV
jgi:2-methylcitrate dehydratase PrpD